jgi:hypothetical protein
MVTWFIYRYEDRIKASSSFVLSSVAEEMAVFVCKVGDSVGGAVEITASGPPLGYAMMTLLLRESKSRRDPILSESVFQIR